MKILLSILLTCSVSFASMKIYKNSTELTYTPASKFIGFNPRIKASDIDGSIAIIKDSCLNSKLSTCSDIKKLIKLSANKKTLTRQRDVMSKLLDNFYSDYKSAKVNVEYISKVSQTITKLDEEITANNNKLSILQQSIKLPIDKPYYLSKLPKHEVKLNFSGITFYSKYILNIDENKLKHSLNIKNRSGIDIKKTTAYIFDRNHYATTANTAFRPSTVSKAQQRVYKTRNLSKSVMPVAAMMDSESSFGAAPVISKTETKSYKIQNFSLKADNVEKKFVVDSKNIKVNKKTIWRAWQYGAFVQGEFDIADTLENNRIDIVYKNSLTKNNFIRIEGSKQIFNIVQDYDLKVKRKEVPTYTQSKGLFNSDTMTKKTVKLQVTNMSNTTKKFEIYEKIPVSTDEDIQVELNTKTSFNYNKKNGKLKLHVELKAKEFKEFIYEYTIRHPKKVKVSVHR